jgi:predicted nucleic acid-binding Zn ribbon protein
MGKIYYPGIRSPVSQAISMRCPECNSAIAAEADKCSRCGYVLDLAHEQLARSHRVRLLTASLLLMLLIVSVLALAFLV